MSACMNMALFATRTKYKEPVIGHGLFTHTHTHTPKWNVPAKFLFMGVRALYPGSLFTCSVARWHFSLCRQRTGNTPYIAKPFISLTCFFFFFKVAGSPQSGGASLFCALPPPLKSVSVLRVAQSTQLDMFLSDAAFCVGEFFPTGQNTETATGEAGPP